MKAIGMVSIIFLVMFVSDVQGGTLYRYVDENGNVVFSDSPAPGKTYKKHMDMEKTDIQEKKEDPAVKGDIDAVKAEVKKVITDINKYLSNNPGKNAVNYLKDKKYKTAPNITLSVETSEKGYNIIAGHANLQGECNMDQNGTIVSNTLAAIK